MTSNSTPAQQRRRNARIRREVLAAYGGECVCCGETEEEFLTLDHIDSDGAAKRRARTGRNGGNQAHAARMHFRATSEWPDDLRVLCFNCNWSAYRGDGICVHQRAAV